MARPPSSRSSSNPDVLHVGSCGKPVGLRGEVEVLITSDDPNRFAVGANVLRADDGSALTVASVRLRRDRHVVSFTQIDDRDAAERLRGIDLVVERGAARRLEAGEYWDHQLIGCAAHAPDGRRLGAVTDVVHQPSGELLVIDDTHLVPLVSELVTEIEPGVRVVIDPIPGLLDPSGQDG